MEKLKDKIFKTSNMRTVLLQINNYANDHQLTAEQISNIFDEGIIASVRNGTLQVPIYFEDTLPGVPDDR